MKDFNKWNEIKQKIDKYLGIITFHEREIWWSHIGINVGDEQDGKNDNFERPILILRKFNNLLLIGIPLSTKIKEVEHYVNLETNNLKYSALLSQTKIMSSKRLIRKVNLLTPGQFKKVKENYKKLLRL
jgi:mRNA interferase MazF